MQTFFLKPGSPCLSSPISHHHPLDPFLPQEDAQPPRFLGWGVHPCLPILRVSVFAATKSSLCPRACDPHSPLYCPSPAISEGLVSSGSLSSERVRLDFEPHPPLSALCLGRGSALGGWAARPYLWAKPPFTLPQHQLSPLATSRFGDSMSR